MTRIEIERSLEKAVAEALGVELPKRHREARPMLRRASGAPRKQDQRQHVPA